MRPLQRKEFLQQRAAIGLEHAADDRCAMIEPGIVRDLVERVAGAPLGITRAIDDCREAGLDDRSGAHRAGLQRDIQRTVEQAPGLERLGGLRDGDHFRMRGGIVERFALIESFSDHTMFMDDDRAHRDLGAVKGPLRLIQRLPHPEFVFREVERIHGRDTGPGKGVKPPSSPGWLTVWIVANSKSRGARLRVRCTSEYVLDDVLSIGARIVIWDGVRGHDLQVEMFRRAIARGRLAHAYLLIGPSGIGKRLFARTVAQCLFCERIPDTQLDACGECPSCRQMQAGTHPDLLTIGLPEGKRILPISLIVGDEATRGRSGLCYEIAMAPMSAGRRIAIIDNAEAMNEEAANALLKTLEEPPPGSVLFLLTPDTEPILPTIRSRCQPVRFSPLGRDDLLALLRQEGLDAGGDSDVIEMAGGSLDVARQLLDPGLKKLWKTVESQLHAPKLDSLQAVKQISEALDELGNDTAAQRENMHWVVGFAIESLRSQLAETSDVDQLDRLGEMLDRCFLAELHLKQTMPVPLCLEALFAELGRRSRMMLQGTSGG